MTLTTKPALSTTISQQTLTYLPAALAGIQAAEHAAPEAPGVSKLAAVLAGIQAASQAAEAIPNPQVQGIAALVNLSVAIFNALGTFRHRSAPAVPLALR
jgi:hypothetical protein